MAHFTDLSKGLAMSSKTIKFTNIQWDADGNEDSLPKEWETNVDSDFNPEEDGEDLLSDTFEFCVLGFNYEIKK